MKTDFDKWKDEDEDDVDSDPKDMAFEDVCWCMYEYWSLLVYILVVCVCVGGWVNVLVSSCHFVCVFVRLCVASCLFAHVFMSYYLRLVCI